MPTSLLGILLCAASQTGTPADAEATHLGAYLTTIDGFARPVAVALVPGEDGGTTLWVAESGRGSVPAGTRLISLAKDGSVNADVRLGQGSLAAPSAIAIDADGRALVTDLDGGLLVRIDPSGEVTTLREDLTGPVDVDVDRSASIVVSEWYARRVTVLDAEGRELLAVDPGPLIEPAAACFANRAEGRALFVIDPVRHRIERYGWTGDASEHAASFSDWGYFPSLTSNASGLAFANGRLYVADRDNHRVQVFDVERPEDPVHGFLYSFGVHAIRPGEGAGKLHYPSDVAVTPDGELLAICEPLDDRVQLFGRAPGEAPAPDPLRAGLGAPAAHFGGAIAASGQYLATVSPESHTVEIRDYRGEQPARVAELYGFGTRLGMLRNPVDVWLGDEGRTLLVVDTGNRRLSRAKLRVRPDEPLAQEPELAWHTDAVDLDALDPDKPFVPCAVTAIESPEGRRYVVADRAGGTLLYLDEDLRPVTSVVLPDGAMPVALLAAPGPSKVTVTTTDGIEVYDQDGAPTGWKLPTSHFASFGHAAEVAGRLIVSDPLRDRIEPFEFDGASFRGVGGFGTRGLGPREFNEPRGIAVLGDGRWIVMDHGNHRGQIFDSEGNLLGGFGGRLYVAGLKE